LAPYGVAVDYLLAKARGSWVTGVTVVTAPPSDYAVRKKKASANTLKAVGEDLTNFLDWCEARNADWRTVSYEQLEKRYVGDMIAGRWSKRNKGTIPQPSTINRRLLYVSDFLYFAAKSGQRDPFQLHFEKVRDPRTGEECGWRQGNVRHHPRSLRVPTHEELSRWLTALEHNRGRSPYLMAKTVIRLGLRAEETILLRAEQVPPVPADRNRGSVEMWIRHGTKGGRTPNDPEKNGKERPIRVPVDFLMELHGYARGHRMLCLKAYRESAKKMGSALPPPKELFLSRHTGRPYSYGRFHALWTSTLVPFKGFSPHLGRHTWAFYTLLEKIREQARLSTGVDGPLSGFVAGLTQSLIETYIQPQLGHVDPSTSTMYTNWVTEMIDLMPTVSAWWDHLEGRADE
jgi:integrase